MLQRGAILSGKYRIDGVLGEGGMAVVYAVTHLRNTARLAVKVLHADSVLKSNVRARFVREGKVANSVNHPGAVQMLDDGIAEDGSPYLVMEHLHGECVGNMALRALPLAAALNIAYQVLDVLRAAHENGIIHRDIKPANLFLLRDGRIKVLDFGISRLHDGAEPFDSIATGSVMGTPFFMAPEQARADAREIDTRTDVFAVGATLFLMISGKYLHTGDESRQVMIQAATQQARSLATVAPGTPQAVIDLVAKAVAYERTARWESAQAMQDAVRQVHEACYGPIHSDALAALLQGREFRRKSHAKLTGPQRSIAWDCRQSSPLSTTLPAVASLTRSRESERAATEPSSFRETPSSRLSEAPELAGWTGRVRVPTEAQASAQTLGTTARLGRALGDARALRSAVIAAALATSVLGLAHLRSQPRAPSAKPAASSELPLPAPRADLKLDTLPASVWVPAEQEAQTPRVRRRAPALLPAKPRASSMPQSPRPSQPLTRELNAPSAPAERLNDIPTLISPPEPFAR